MKQVISEPVMITRELLREIRNDLPMRLTIVRLGGHGPIAKQSDGYFRFQCPGCGELRATVNPRNNRTFMKLAGVNEYETLLDGTDVIVARRAKVLTESWSFWHYYDRVLPRPRSRRSCSSDSVSCQFSSPKSIPLCTEKRTEKTLVQNPEN